MRETTGKDQPKKRGRPPNDGPELRVVGIGFNPAHDARDRLRRLFTILSSHFAGDDGTGTELDGPPVGSPSEGGDE